MTMLQYMEANPWMTLVILACFVAVVRIVLSLATVWIRGYPPPHCDIEGRSLDD